VSTGPFDVADVNLNDGINRIDLGGLIIPTLEGVDVQVQVDESSGKVTSVTLASGDAAVQVQPFSAPRSGSMWDDVRLQIRDSISQGGGLVEETTGDFGPELRAQINAGDGSSGLQPARFVGIDGPRWFLRAIFLGTAARPGDSALHLEKALRSLIVVRGGEAMPVGTPLVLRMPQLDASAGETTTEGMPSPFVRGPEITETR
jgi:hypothetical protein